MDPKVLTRNNLHSACYDNQIGRIQRILATGSPHIDSADGFGWTGLMFSTSQKNSRAVRLLLDEGASVLPFNAKGSTALTIASRIGCLKITNILIAAGSDLEADERQGRTPLRLAIIGEHPDVVEALLKAGAGLSHEPLHHALQIGNVPVIKILLDHGADHSAVSKIYYPASTYRSRIVPLDIGAAHGQLRAVSYMLSRFGLQGCQGDGFALEGAAHLGHLEVLHALVASGAQDTTGRALVAALVSSMMESVKLLLRQYKNHSLTSIDSATDTLGCTALLIAIRTGNVKVVQWLIEAGASTTKSASLCDANGEFTGFATPLGLVYHLEEMATAEEEPTLVAIRHLLLREKAVKSTSWAWGFNNVAKTPAPTAGTTVKPLPVVRMVRGGGSRVVTRALLGRYAGKMDM